MFQHVRQFRKRHFVISFVKKIQDVSLMNSSDSQEIFLNPIKRYKQNILFCTHIRLRFIMLKNYKLPMQKISTSLKKTDLNSEKKRLESHQQMEPKTATLQKILQFASSYRVERITENQFVEWYLN
jgi:hypothetical protein